MLVIERPRKHTKIMYILTDYIALYVQYVCMGFATAIIALNRGF